MKQRRLKVYYAHAKRKYTKYPVIRLGGSYLAKAGFNIKDCITVTISPGNILITKHNQNYPSETEAGSAGAQPVKG